MSENINKKLFEAKRFLSGLSSVSFAKIWQGNSGWASRVYVRFADEKTEECIDWCYVDIKKKQVVFCMHKNATTPDLERFCTIVQKRFDAKPIVTLSRKERNRKLRHISEDLIIR